MFTINPNPTIPASIKITGQAREQTLEVVFRHKARSEYAAMLQKIAKGELDAADALVDVIESWNADAEPTAESLKRLDDVQPGAAWAILTAYGDALTVARKGN